MKDRQELTGIYQASGRGFGFLIPEEGEDCFIPPRADGGAWNGDKVAARITEEETQLIRQTAVKAFKALGCRGLARVDFFLLPDGSCVLNEPNTLPGFTKISMYPKLFIDSGLTYPEIIDRLITLAIEAE